MSRFRRDLPALISATVALLSMLFVATATLAASPPGREPAVMAMSSDMPCEQETTPCSTDCTVFCQILVARTPMVDRPIRYSEASYRVRAIALGSLSVEAEDPPPR